MRTAAAIIGLTLLAATLWYVSAYPRGMFVAGMDYILGYHEIKTYGFPVRVFNEDYPKRLQERYGVGMTALAGCCVSWDVRMYADGYNAVAKPLLNRLHGRDIFAECW